MKVPLEAITGSTLENLLLYTVFLGVLLLVASLIRLKVPFLKNWYIPASLIAGIFGLILGPYCLKVVPQEIMSSWSSLSGVLMTIVLAPAMMGAARGKGKGVFKKAVNAACFTYSVTGMQFAIPLLLTLVLFVPAFGVNELFAGTFEAGWAGGHGVAAALTPVFEQLGWGEAGTSLCLVNATVGLLVGLIGGIILINIGVRKGWTKHISSSAKMKNDNVELFPADQASADTREVISSGVIDNLSFHAAVLSVVLLLGWLASKALALINISLPWFCTSVLVGFFVQKLLLNKTSWGQALDPKCYSRIQGLALEFVVAGGVASINLTVVMEYAIPLLITSVALLAFMILYVTWYAPKVLGKYWFETSMILYGAFCGVMATGLVLLKTCDPEMKSDAAEVYAARLIFTGFATGGGIITCTMPLWQAQLGGWVTLAIFAGLMIIAGALPFILRFNKVDQEEKA